MMMVMVAVMVVVFSACFEDGRDLSMFVCKRKGVVVQSEKLEEEWRKEKEDKERQDTGGDRSCGFEWHRTQKSGEAIHFRKKGKVVLGKRK